jgi:predicted N-acyltransferase
VQDLFGYYIIRVCLMPCYFNLVSVADYKWARGFDPALIHSAHYICHPGLRQAVSQYIDYETETNVELTEYLMQKSVVGSGYNRE